MKSILTRPPAPVLPVEGLLRKDHFQVSYVTNDLERACRLFSTRYGVSRFEQIRGEMPAGGTIAAAFAWVGGTLYEIIEAHGPETAFYNDRLPPGEFGIRFHHLGFLIHDRSAWNSLERELEEQGWRIAAKLGNNGLMEAVYVDAPELGHYVEYIYPEPAGIEFLERIPVN